MRIEPYPDGWVIHYGPNELQLSNVPRACPHGGILGFINRRGTIRVSYPAGYTPREWGSVARSMLEDARAELWESGALRNPREERARAEEARLGSFIVRLNDGRERRFSSFKTDQPYLRGARARPGAYDWIETELKAGHASYAEIFRDAPPAIYTQPKILPAHSGFEPVTVETHAHFPIDYSMRTEHGWLIHQMPKDVWRAYDLKRNAMRLIDQRWQGERSVTPEQIMGAWAVAQDAFEEGNVPFQAAYARANADYWSRRAGVSSRRAASASRRRSQK